MKPNFNDIKALIEQAEKLKQEVEHLKEKSFLTQVQSKAIKAGTDTALYLLRLSHTNEKECLSNFGIVDNYFVPTGSVNKGRFAQNLRLPSAVDYRREEPERIEWYNPKKHTGLVVRYDFDEKKFWHFLNQYKAKQRQLYWKNHIQPLIVQLDTDLTPWLPFMKPYIDTERIQKAINTAEAGTLSDAIYEFKKIQKVVETEVKQEPAKAQPPSGEKADLASTKQNGEKAKSKGRGRPQMYNEKFLQRVYATFEQKYQKRGHKQQAWQETAEEHNLKSGKAAEIACRRYLKKQNKKQN